MPAKRTQSLLAALLICSLEITRLEAVVLAALFGVPLVFPSEEVQLAFSALYLGIFLGLLIHSRIRRRHFVDMFRASPQ